jgi:hypothetical protein
MIDRVSSGTRLTPRSLEFSLVAALLLGAFGSGICLQGHASRPQTFVHYAPEGLPQRTQGDFDGDGRIDTVLIQDRAGIAHLSIQLSGSPSAIELDSSVVGVVQGDVDHDGDLDLVGSTANGDLLIWLNDGHGRFTRQLPSDNRGFAALPTVRGFAWHHAPAIGFKSPALPASGCRTAALVDAPHEPRVTDIAGIIRRAALPALRAPPSLL